LSQKILNKNSEAKIFTQKFKQQLLASLRKRFIRDPEKARSEASRQISEIEI
jgi:hypothetical protein